MSSDVSAAPRRGGAERFRRVLTVVTMLVLVVALPLFRPMSGSASADPDNPLPRTYQGPGYSSGLPSDATQFASQSKTWFHDDAWWALMVGPTNTSLRVYELRPDHTWRPTTAVLDAAPGDTGDAVAAGDTTDVVFRRVDSTVGFVKLGYDPETREYAVSQPATVVSNRGSLPAPANVVRDTTGRLWVAFVTPTDIVVNYSDTDGRTWLDRPSEMIIPIPGNGPDRRPAGSLVAFDRSIGVLWTEQNSGLVRFGIHRDGAPPSEWSTETALAGPGLAGGELSVKVVPGEPSDSVVAAVRTLNGTRPTDPPDAPSVNVLVRGSGGAWSSRVGATVADRYQSAIMQVDGSNRTVYLLSPSGGDVRYKDSSVSTMSFAPGPGSVLVEGQGRRLTGVTGSKQPVNARTGLVPLASDKGAFLYQHAELALPGVPPPPDRPDTTPPTSPGELTARSGGPSGVGLAWSASNDGPRWSAGVDQSSVARYLVYRDGVQVGETTMTSYGDTPPAGGRSYGYSVRAADSSGNLSVPASATAAVPESDTSSTGVVVGGILLVLAVTAGAVVGFRRLRMRRASRT